jgi:hypothetical protein
LSALNLERDFPRAEVGPVDRLELRLLASARLEDVASVMDGVPFAGWEQATYRDTAWGRATGLTKSGESAIFARLLDHYGQDLAARRVFFEFSLGRLGAYGDRSGNRAPGRAGRRTAGGLGSIIGPAGDGSVGRGPSGPVRRDRPEGDRRNVPGLARVRRGPVRGS